jgi:tRNA(Ile2) C34 agmatinyltransferase TiaS
MAAVATASRAGAPTGSLTLGRSAQRLFEPGEITLEDAILGALEDLAERGRTECPVCGGRLRAATGCDVCGTELS